MEVGTAPPGAGVPDTDAWAQAALATLRALPGVRRVGLALAEGGGRRLLFTASDRATDAVGVGVGVGVVAWCHIDAYERLPLNTAVRTGSPVHGTLGALRIRFPEFVDRQLPGTAAVAAVPVRAVGQTLGAFVLFFSADPPFDPHQVAALSQLGEDLGISLRTARRRAVDAVWEAHDDLPTPGARSALHIVPAELAEAGPARHFVLATLAGWAVAEEDAQTAALCLSELVTNALIHTHDGCRVRLLLEGRVLTVAVRDHGRGPEPTPAAQPDPLAVHGRGLQVVAALADRWGSELTANGMTVWFVLDL